MPEAEGRAVGRDGEMKKWMWLEEYRHCGCTFLARVRRELLGYCEKHGNDRRRVHRLPFDPSVTFGHAK